MMKHPLPNGLWLSCPTRAERRLRNVAAALLALIEVSAEEAVFWLAAVIGLGGSIWMLAVCTAWYLR